MMQSLAKKKEVYNEFFLEKKLSGTSTSIEDCVDVIEKFKEALEMFGVRTSKQSTERAVSGESAYGMLDSLKQTR